MRLILFLAWCFAEALVIGDVAERIGALWVFLALIAAAAAGVSLIQRSGWRTLVEMQRNMDSGELPLRTMLNGALGIIAGLLLILPGFLSDALALGLLLKLWWQRDRRGPGGPGGPGGPVTLDGDFREVDPSRLDDARPDSRRPDSQD